VPQHRSLGRRGSCPEYFRSETAAKFVGRTLPPAPKAFTLACRYSEGFVAGYIVPMCAAIWSAPANKVLAFPVQMLVRFWVNHHLLNILERPVWRVVKDRSQSYVARALEGIQHVRTGTPVRAVKAVTTDGGARLNKRVPQPCKILNFLRNISVSKHIRSVDSFRSSSHK
jgi:hypothetical protein